MCHTARLEELSWARRCRRSMNSAHAPPLTSTVIRMMKKVHVSITSPLPSVKQHTALCTLLLLLLLHICSHSTAGHTDQHHCISPGRSCTACSDNAKAMAPRRPLHHIIACTQLGVR
jgi:hypothetical protein